MNKLIKSKNNNLFLKLLFWQPKIDFLSFFEHGFWRETTLIFLNYFIWLFFFFVSFKLICFDINFFGRLFIATLFAEIIERFLKRKRIWLRPMFSRHQIVPKGLVNNWYYSGSFPSGHTMKATFFLLFIIFTGVLPLSIFLSIVIPLLTFRVLVGFHYPIDILGGIIMGIILWFLTKNLVFPADFNNFISIIFNFVFFIK
jgi:membrane-associated phospholipid phosphatase